MDAMTEKDKVKDLFRKVQRTLVHGIPTERGTHFYSDETCRCLWKLMRDVEECLEL
jgi:hypothetical protein